jgi:hypothetical protein
MPQINFITKFKKNTDQIFSIEELKSKYIFGLDIQKFGNEMSDDIYNNAIHSAQQQIEEILQIKLIKQIYSEQKHFNADDFRSWSYIPTQYPVACPLRMTGFIGSIRQVVYPKNWLSVKTSSDGQYLQRQINIVPNTQATNNQLIIYSGLMPNLGYLGNHLIPNYWRLTYVTGFNRDQIPQTILQVIGKLAVINAFVIASDGLLIYPGISSTSISIDGLSQSLSGFANSNAGIFGATIKAYSDQLFGRNGRDGEIQRLKDTYLGIVLLTA